MVIEQYTVSRAILTLWEDQPYYLQSKVLMYFMFKPSIFLSFLVQFPVYSFSNSLWMKRQKCFSFVNHAAIIQYKINTALCKMQHCYISFMECWNIFMLLEVSSFGFWTWCIFPELSGCAKPASFLSQRLVPLRTCSLGLYLWLGADRWPLGELLVICFFYLLMIGDFVEDLCGSRTADEQ